MHDVRALQSPFQNMAMPPSDLLSELLLALYTAPRTCAPWGAFLDQLCSLLAARRAALGFTEPNLSSPDLIFIGGERTDDTRPIPQADRCTAAVTTPDAAVVLANGQELRIDIHRGHSVGMYLRITRACTDAPFGHREKALLNLLMPHLRQLLAYLDRERIQRIERGVYEGISHHLSLGTVLLDRTGTVVHSNANAQLHLDRGACIFLRNRKLLATKGLENRRLQAIVQHCIRGSEDDHCLPQAISLSGGRDSEKLLLSVSPARIRASSPNIAAGDDYGPGRLFDLDPCDNGPVVAIQISTAAPLTDGHQRLLQQLFNFTPKEARMALALANGLSINDIAEDLCVSRNTLRTHLVKAYQKAGVHRQSALVSVILRSIAGLG